jgi:hypothetical protein
MVPTLKKKKEDPSVTPTLLEKAAFLAKTEIVRRSRVLYFVILGQHTREKKLFEK